MIKWLGRLLAASVGVMVAAGAWAQTPFNWTGFYAGVNAGAGFMQGSAWNYCISPVGGLQGLGCPIQQNFRADQAGFLGGAQAGYNRQFDWLVVGLEVDFQGSTMGVSQYATNQGFTPGVGNQPLNMTIFQRIDWLATMRARVGLVGDERWLFFATGGLAVAQARLDSRQTFIPPGIVTFQGTTQNTMVGYTFGAGVEYALFDNFTIKGEVLYFDLGKLKTAAGATPPVNTFVVGAEAWFGGVITRIGGNYRF